MNNFLSAIFKLIFLGVIIVPILVMCTISKKLDNEEQVDSTLIDRAKINRSLYITVTPTQITDLYEENKFAVDERFEGKLVSISGTIRALTKVLSTPVMELDGEGSQVTFFPSRLYLDFSGDDAKIHSIFAKVRVGQAIRALCFGSGGVHFRCYSNSLH